MFKAKNLVKISIIVILTTVGISSSSTSPIKKGPEYYNYYVPEQIHKTWIDLNNNGLMDPYENTKLPIEDRIEDLLSRMTLDEKVAQIAMPKRLPGKNCESCGDGGVSPAIDRLGIPEFSWYADESLHGVQSLKPATVFPYSIGIAATWDDKLVHKIYTAVGDEFRAAFNVNKLRGLGLITWSPMVLEIPHNKKYERSPETYGEDPYLASRLAVATARGFQGEDEKIPYEKAICTAKHFIYCTGAKDEFPLGTNISQRTIREIIFPAYKAAIREGKVGQVMTGAQGWDKAPHLGGDPINYSPVMLTEVLREGWGFKGIVCSDCGALGEAGVGENLKGAAVALEAGLDSNACGHTYKNNLSQAVKKDLVKLSSIDKAVRNFLRIRFQLGLFDPPQMNPYNNFTPQENVLTQKHIALALKAARESIVLLKNENKLLPLDRKSIQSLAVIGPYADSVRSLIPCDYNGRPPYWVTPFKGIKKAASSETKIRASLSFDTKEAIKAAKEAEVAVVITGPDPAFETTPRKNLALPEGFLPLLQAVAGTGTPTVVILVNGTPIASDWMKKHIPAIIEAWYGGMEGGTALAEVLFGDYNPGGKLPWTYPRVGAGPIYYNYKPGEITYDQSTILWPFGYGLSYSKFAYSYLEISPKSSDSGQVKVKVEVKNVGERKGEAVVEMYLRDVEASVPVPVKQLRGFKRVSLKPGETRAVEFKLKPDDLSLLDENLETRVEPGTFEVMIGKSSEDIVLRDTFEVTAPIKARFNYKNL
ncbi:MAG: glycoside hydrolase family 3 C-terminal domain-containing protein, partial [Candidatus Aminicenantales bacterium]